MEKIISKKYGIKRGNEYYVPLKNTTYLLEDCKKLKYSIIGIEAFTIKNDITPHEDMIADFSEAAMETTWELAKSFIQKIDNGQKNIFLNFVLDHKET